MVACRFVNRQLTAWIDDELGSLRKGFIERHLRRCQACEAESRARRAVVRSQAVGLQQLVRGAPVDVDRLWQGVVRQRELAPASRGFATWLRPLAVATCVVTLSLVGYFSATPTEESVLVPLGIKSPPAALAKKPALFRDYPVIEKLDFLEHFDAVDSLPMELDDGSASKKS